MIEPDGLERPSTTLAGSAATELPAPTDLPAVTRLCPFLLAAGGWRSASAAREHRCTALEPPTKLAADKQRRLCLTAEHAGCPTFLAAADERAGRSGGGPTAAGRFYARTAPVVIERARSPISFETSPGSRRWGQLALVILMVIALGAVIVARSGPGEPSAGDAGASPGVATPAGWTPASTAPTAGGTPAAVATAGAGESSSGRVLAATASPAARPSVAPTAVPSASAAPSADGGTTYTVRRGDTLSAIAIRFGTTITAIQELNRIVDPSLIQVGQTLRIP